MSAHGKPANPDPTDHYFADRDSCNCYDSTVNAAIAHCPTHYHAIPHAPAPNGDSADRRPIAAEFPDSDHHSIHTAHTAHKHAANSDPTNRDSAPARCGSSDDNSIAHICIPDRAAANRAPTDSRATQHASVAHTCGTNTAATHDNPSACNAPTDPNPIIRGNAAADGDPAHCISTGHTTGIFNGDPARRKATNVRSGEWIGWKTHRPHHGSITPWAIAAHRY